MPHLCHYTSGGHIMCQATRSVGFWVTSIRTPTRLENRSSVTQNGRPRWTRQWSTSFVTESVPLVEPWAILLMTRPRSWSRRCLLRKRCSRLGFIVAPFCSAMVSLLLYFCEWYDNLLALMHVFSLTLTSAFTFVFFLVLQLVTK